MRLAKAQGVLQGRRINRVQQFTLEVLHVLDVRREARRRSDDFRDGLFRSIVANDPAKMVDLWPERFSKNHHQQETGTTEVKTEKEIEEALSDTGPTTWVFEDGEVTQEDAERMLAQLAQQSEITLTDEDLDNDSGWI